MGNNSSYLCLDDKSRLKPYTEYFCIKQYTMYSTKKIYSDDYICLDDLVMCSNNLYKKMINYQKDVPDSFSIIIDLDNEENTTVNLNKCFVITRIKVELYKKCNQDTVKFDKYGIIKFFCPYNLALEILDIEFDTPYYKNRYLVDKIEEDNTVELVYDSKPKPKTTFKSLEKVNKANLIEYYKKQLSELEQESYLNSSPTAPAPDFDNPPPPYQTKE